MKFPIYRRYSNGLSLFRIESEKEFIELKRTGGKWELFQFSAKIYPDFQLVQDMIKMHNNHWVECSQDEFDQASTKL